MSVLSRDMRYRPFSQCIYTVGAYSEISIPIPVGRCISSVALSVVPELQSASAVDRASEN